MAFANSERTTSECQVVFGHISDNPVFAVKRRRTNIRKIKNKFGLQQYFVNFMQNYVSQS